ncbi:hypothetical protein BCR33DRAFT_125708 [Rhizoclosmatium globosum]|uniref:Uncharacterized protein n=1 Tax=Rhizoclosmatium globosum TaxID=329046 RepID=A0A1Y2CHA5_9FUNG|nr:hypothetical protein BCR33DRAFT_125708 [Rhizoclosmatium globosum]|eukprot:ORY46316.1 hypothetical protein BCR33DRAFT_125708 [Rhizoclosmatium globosum]
MFCRTVLYELGPNKTSSLNYNPHVSALRPQLAPKLEAAFNQSITQIYVCKLLLNLAFTRLGAKYLVEVNPKLVESMVKEYPASFTEPLLLSLCRHDSLSYEVHIFTSLILSECDKELNHLNMRGYIATYHRMTQIVLKSSRGATWFGHPKIEPNISRLQLNPSSFF